MTFKSVHWKKLMHQSRIFNALFKQKIYFTINSNEANKVGKYWNCLCETSIPEIQENEAYTL